MDRIRMQTHTISQWSICNFLAVIICANA